MDNPTTLPKQAPTGAPWTTLNLPGLDAVAAHSVAGIPGKLFLKEALQLTGMEVSLNSMAAGQGMPFCHRHQQHEELYIFISGHGEFMVDEVVFDVGPGSCVRVAAPASRCWRNTGLDPLQFICVQAPEGGMQGAGGREDGVFSGRPHWQRAGRLSTPTSPALP